MSKVPIISKPKAKVKKPIKMALAPKNTEYTRRGIPMPLIDFITDKHNEQ